MTSQTSSPARKVSHSLAFSTRSQEPDERKQAAWVPLQPPTDEHVQVSHVRPGLLLGAGVGVLVGAELGAAVGCDVTISQSSSPPRKVSQLAVLSTLSQAPEARKQAP